MEKIMHYILIENDEVVSILDYEPAVPDSILTIEISEQDYNKLVTDKTAYFDIPSMKIKDYTEEYINNLNLVEQQEIANAENRKFLDSTDWKVFRHIRERELGVPSTLSKEQYIALEQQRAAAAAAIK